jgi:cell volume regulation protein A
VLTGTAPPPYLEKRQFYGDFTVSGQTPLAELAALYGLPLPDGAEDKTLADFMVETLSGVPVVGDRLRLGNLEFVLREVTEGRILQVGLRIPTHMH